MVNPTDESGRLSVGPSRPRRPNAISRPMPATAGGSTIGSSISAVHQRLSRERGAGQQPGERRPEHQRERQRQRGRQHAQAQRLPDDRLAQGLEERFVRQHPAKIATTGSPSKRMNRPAVPRTARYPGRAPPRSPRQAAGTRVPMGRTSWPPSASTSRRKRGLKSVSSRAWTGGSSKKTCGITRS